MASVTLQIGGTHHHIDCEFLPPIGTRVSVDKYVAGEGAGAVVEVTDHEWRLNEAPADDRGEPTGEPTLDITLRTRRLD